MKNQLRPVTFVQGTRDFYRPNYYVQNILIKALSEGITDPNELKKIAHLDKVADVYRSLDKLAIRKEYHEALTRSGISLDYIVGGIKKLADTADKDAVRLKSLELLLRSLGLEKYEELEISGKNWEEIIIEAEANKAEGEVLNSEDIVEYKIDVPETPEKAKKNREKENKLGRQLYEK